MACGAIWIVLTMPMLKIFTTNVPRRFYKPLRSRSRSQCWSRSRSRSCCGFGRDADRDIDLGLGLGGGLDRDLSFVLSRFRCRCQCFWVRVAVSVSGSGSTSILVRVAVSASVGISAVAVSVLVLGRCLGVAFTDLRFEVLRPWIFWVGERPNFWCQFPIPNSSQDLAAHCLLIHSKNVTFECERHVLHAAALQACGVAFTDLHLEILRS